MSVQRTPVQSSNLNEVAFDPDKQELEVTFTGGGVYVYSGVTPQLFNQFISAPSQGTFFHANIRNSHPARQGKLEN